MMKTKMFYAKSMSEGLKKISAEFGDDAIILSNRKVQGGVEIMAAMEEGEEVIETYAYKPSEAAAPDSIIKNQNVKRSGTTKEELAQMLSNIGPFSKKSASTESPRVAQAAAPKFEPVAVKDSSNDELIRMQDEIRSLKAILESQSQQLSVRQSSVASAQPEPDAVETIRDHLAGLGFEFKLVNQLTDSLSDRAGIQQCWSQVQNSITADMEVYQSDLVSKGGIYAFVGMTGSGKTTSLSKMAARFVIDHGPQDLLLITLDKFKVGSQDGLKSMANILKCDFEVPGSSQSLESILTRYASKKLILIDTCGSFIGKEYFARQLENGQLVKKVRSLEVLPCSASYRALQRDHKSNEMLQVSGAIMSKADECPEAGSVFSMLLEYRLPLAYWSNGQKIPEDLHQVNASRLVRTLLGRPMASASAFDAEELKMIANF